MPGPGDPVAAAAEVRRCARDQRLVQVLFKGRHQEPMGRRRYWPIYEACAEERPDVAPHAFGAYGHPITGAGHNLLLHRGSPQPSQSAQANVTSLGWFSSAAKCSREESAPPHNSTTLKRLAKSSP